MDYNKKYYKNIRTAHHRDLYPSSDSSFDIRSPDQLRSPEGPKAYGVFPSPEINPGSMFQFETDIDENYRVPIKNRKNPYAQSFRVNKFIKIQNISQNIHNNSKKS